MAIERAASLDVGDRAIFCLNPKGSDRYGWGKNLVGRVVNVINRQEGNPNLVVVEDETQAKVSIGGGTRVEPRVN